MLNRSSPSMRWPTTVEKPRLENFPFPCVGESGWQYVTPCSDPHREGSHGKLSRCPLLVSVNECELLSKTKCVKRGVTFQDGYQPSVKTRVNTRLGRHPPAFRRWHLVHRLSAWIQTDCSKAIRSVPWITLTDPPLTSSPLQGNVRDDETSPLTSERGSSLSQWAYTSRQGLAAHSRP